MDNLTIRPLHHNDFPYWLPLWDANNLGQQDETLTTETWTRLIDSDYPVHGLCAIKNGELVAIMHYILHPITGHINPACYMQDLYVREDYRKQGIARTMVGELHRIGKKEKWARIYWLADSTNKAAQALYKNLGVKLNFSLHILPTEY